MKFVQLILRKIIKTVNYHEMSDFKAKMQQIRIRLAPPQTPQGQLTCAPPDPLAGFEGPTSKGGEGREKGMG